MNRSMEGVDEEGVWTELLGASLTFLRRRRGLTRRQLAERMGDPKINLEPYESGKAWPDGPRLWRLLAVLGVSPGTCFLLTSKLLEARDLVATAPSPEHLPSPFDPCPGAEALALLRLVQERSLAEVAARSGVSERTIRSYESGAQFPRFRTLHKLLRSLNLSMLNYGRALLVLEQHASIPSHLSAQAFALVHGAEVDQQARAEIARVLIEGFSEAER